MVYLKTRLKLRLYLYNLPITISVKHFPFTPHQFLLGSLAISSSFILSNSCNLGIASSIPDLPLLIDFSILSSSSTCFSSSAILRSSSLRVVSFSHIRLKRRLTFLQLILTHFFQPFNIRVGNLRHRPFFICILSAFTACHFVAFTPLRYFP